MRIPALTIAWKNGNKKLVECLLRNEKIVYQHEIRLRYEYIINWVLFQK